MKKRFHKNPFRKSEGSTFKKKFDRNRERGFKQREEGEQKPREKREPKPWEKKNQKHWETREPKPWEKRRVEKRFERKQTSWNRPQENLKKAFSRAEKQAAKSPSAPAAASQEGEVRLNKFLSNAGICSRREADKYIEAGAVKVNGKIVTQLGYRVQPGDKVEFGGMGVKREKNVYILLNKPRGYITTTDDERGRATVLDLIKEVPERIYPVGRLDRNTSGLLLLTNDGDLAAKLMHPKFRVPKVYHVTLDKALKPDDLDKLRSGIELEDGFIKPDDIAYVQGAETKKEAGIEIHSGRNRIVRRMFEHLGYRVEKLDRVLYAGLTKKNLPRGKWRFLAENEVRWLRKAGR